MEQRRICPHYADLSAGVRGKRKPEPEAGPILSGTAKPYSAHEVVLGQQFHAVCAQTASSGLGGKGAVKYLELDFSRHICRIVDAEQEPVFRPAAGHCHALPRPAGLERMAMACSRAEDGLL